MDEAYRGTALIAEHEERRLVLMRSLVLSPSASGKPRYVWSWGRLRRATGLHPDTLQKRWARGIARIVTALNQRSAVFASGGSVGGAWPGMRMQRLPGGGGRSGSV